MPEFYMQGVVKRWERKSSKVGCVDEIITSQVLFAKFVLFFGSYLI